MATNDLPLYRLIGQRLGWLAQRQRIVTNNIANANTPRFKPFDLKPMDFADLTRNVMAKTPMSVTNQLHLIGNKAAGGGSADFRENENRRPKTYDTTLDGNAVSLERELMKTSETSTQYELVTRLYRKHVDMFKEAIGKRQ